MAFSQGYGVGAAGSSQRGMRKISPCTAKNADWVLCESLHTILRNAMCRLPAVACGPLWKERAVRRTCPAHRALSFYCFYCFVGALSGAQKFNFPYWPVGFGSHTFTNHHKETHPKTDTFCIGKAINSFLGFKVSS